MTEQKIHGPTKRTFVTFTEEERKQKEELHVTWRFLINKGLEHQQHCGFTNQKRLSSEMKQRLYDLEHSKNLTMAKFIKDRYPKVYEELQINIPFKDDAIKSYRGKIVKASLRGDITYQGEVISEDDEYITIREKYKTATFRRDEITVIEINTTPQEALHETDETR